MGDSTLELGKLLVGRLLTFGLSPVFSKRFDYCCIDLCIALVQGTRHRQDIIEKRIVLPFSQHDPQEDPARVGLTASCTREDLRIK